MIDGHRSYASAEEIGRRLAAPFLFLPHVLKGFFAAFRELPEQPAPKPVARRIVVKPVQPAMSTAERNAAISALLRSGTPQEEIAARFGLSQGRISQINKALH